MPPSSFYAVISGVGSGTGASVARLFSKTYPVVLMARSASNYEPVVEAIRASGGQALGITADASDAKAMKEAFDKIKIEMKGMECAAAVYNANAGFSMKSILDLKEEELDLSLNVAAKGLMYFAQNSLPSLLSAVPSSPHPPSLIITGATASLRGGARFGGFAAGKFAQRALAQSMAREFGPKGVHVALAIIDGGIDVPWAPKRGDAGVEDGKLSPDAIAQSYWNLHTQHRSAMTHELDLRPYAEKF